MIELSMTKITNIIIIMVPGLSTSYLENQKSLVNSSISFGFTFFFSNSSSSSSCLIFYFPISIEIGTFATGNICIVIGDN